MITRMEHAGLSVADLDRSIAFYRDLLGMRLVRVIESGPEMPLGTIVGMPGATARIAHLESGTDDEPGMMLELFQYTSPEGTPIPQDRRQADHGFIHAGFTSTDTRADFARLRDAGVEFLSDPVEYRPGVWVVYFRGPDGEVCELRQT
jgi:catechol 2,3-dioxygenase-like lactoylglutathione lyase family enzyme